MPVGKGGGGGGAGGALSFAQMSEVQVSGTAGGVNTTGAWATRALNTTDTDLAGIIVSLSANAFTLSAGTYLIFARAPFSQTQRTKVRLFNVTDSAVALLGDSGYSAEYNRSIFVTGLVKTTAQKAFRLEYFAASNVDNAGLGLADNIAAVNEVYAVVQVSKIG